MPGELAQLAGQITPWVTAAASAYGGAVLAQSQEEAANATVGFGRRLARRIFSGGDQDGELPGVLADVIGDPEDPGHQAALLLAIRDALANDPGLAAQVREMAGQAQAAGIQVTTFGERSPGVGINWGTINTGDSTERP